MRQEEQRASNEHPEAVRSTPVPVPPAEDRADRADVPEDVISDRGTFDDPTVAGERRTADRPDGADAADDRTEFHEPGPVPTAFGATSVGGAVAASALASPRPEDEPDPRTEWTARPGDGAADGPREGRRADPTAELHGPRGTAEQRPGGDPEEPSGAPVGRPDTAGGDPGRRANLIDRGGDPDATGAAGYGSATPVMVDPDTASPEAGAAIGGQPATTVPAEPATLFEADVAQRFRDRWRDVQLRFVDDPRAAAGEAQALVDEAIQALASALSAQKSRLGAWQDAGSADTEQLRMAVRQYRDFLDRVLGR
ncbi:hypothetical protein Q3W71_10875 [Micromonospora sp. C28SCA-DRY-2]|uniref:hypothetical protein n=1 Tax=Micromonospora sp. C28SCA-DRY-2 TaxID=3059522 RepID=UPI0026756EF3|nr:hypothetical protein [Micromonospora sp. C28SCA-DRY-2]MDO3702179.1 hypothetical protein [Micromonospora sp. C28SCA-DRY-2]